MGPTPMTTSLKSALLKIEGATTEAQSAAIAMQVLANSFFPVGLDEYPIWAHPHDATAFQHLSDGIIERINRVQDLVQAAFAAEQEASS